MPAPGELPDFTVPGENNGPTQPQPAPAPQSPAAPPTPPQPATNWPQPGGPAPTPQFMQPPPQQFMQAPQQQPQFMQASPQSVAPQSAPPAPSPVQEEKVRGKTSPLDVLLLGLAVFLPFPCFLTLYFSPFTMLVLTICSALRIKHFMDRDEKAPFTTWTALGWAGAMTPITLLIAMWTEDWSLDQMSQG